jgi:hypothetical protein
VPVTVKVIRSKFLRQSLEKKFCAEGFDVCRHNELLRDVLKSPSFVGRIVSSNPQNARPNLSFGPQKSAFIGLGPNISDSSAGCDAIGWNRKTVKKNRPDEENEALENLHVETVLARASQGKPDMKIMNQTSMFSPGSSLNN